MDATPVVPTATAPAVPGADPSQPVIFSIRTLTGKVWQVGDAPPVAEVSPSKILKIVPVSNAVGQERFDVFSYPTAGSEMAKQEMGSIYSVYPNVVDTVTTYAKKDAWTEKLTEAIEGLEVECPHCGMLPSEEEEPEPPPPPVPS